MHLKLREQAYLVKEPSGALRIKSPWTELVWKQPSSSLCSALQTLANEPADEELLSHRALEEEGDRGLILFFHTLDQLKQKALLSLTVFSDQTPFLALQPLGSSMKWREEAIDEEEPLTLSRYTVSSTLNGERVLETPLNVARIILKAKESLSLIRALVTPTTFKQLSQKLPHLSAELIEKSLKLLKSAKML